MFGFGKNKRQQSAVEISQTEIDATARGYEDIINEFAQIDGVPLNRFIYNNGWFDSSDGSFVFLYFADEELVPEEAAILEEAFSIIGKGSSVIKVDLTASDEIRFKVRII